MEKDTTDQSHSEGTRYHPSKPSTDLDRFVLASPAPTNPKTSTAAGSIRAELGAHHVTQSRSTHHMEVDVGFRHEAPCTRKDEGNTRLTTTPT